MEKETSIIQIVFETEYEETDSKFPKPLYIGRRASIDGVEVYSDRMEARAYYKRTDPIRECLRFISGEISEHERNAERIRSGIIEKISELIMEEYKRASNAAK